MPDGTPAIAVDDPHYMGPIIQAQKDTPVRIVFYNLLPSGSDGDLFIPMDSTFMGAGMGPKAMDAMPPEDLGTVLDGVRNPMCGETIPRIAELLRRNPGEHPPARRHHALDQRRLAASVDHPCQ